MILLNALVAACCFITAIYLAFEQAEWLIIALNLSLGIINLGMIVYAIS